MPFLKYVGPHERAEVLNFGHFGYGEEKKVDEVTAGAFRDDRCRKEGWVVRGDDDPKSLAPHNAHPVTNDALTNFHIIDASAKPQHVPEVTTAKK